MKYSKLLPILCFGLLGISSCSDTVPVRVLTYNLWDGGKAFGKYTDQRLEAVCERFKESYEDEEGLDVIFVQELWPIKERKEALDRCGYPYVATVEQDYDDIEGRFSDLLVMRYGDKVDTGMRILSRYPLSNVKRHTYTATGSKITAFKDAEYIVRKSVMMAELHHPEAGILAVFNTHIISNHPHAKYHEERRLQLQELGDFVQQNSSGYAGVIVGGDFNIGPVKRGDEPYKNPEYSWETIMPTIFPHLGHVAQTELCTWCPSMNELIEEENGVDQIIDHLFASKNFVVKRAVVVMKEKITLELEEGPKEIPLSDHYGVEAELLMIRKQ